MAEQAELDLPPLASPAPQVQARPRAVFAGFTRWQILGGVLLLGALIWAMWITRQVSARQDHIVSVRLSDLVGEYVEAQRFSASPPERVKAEMQAFMASLDKELARRSAGGDVVLVGEAVLSKNVDDITDTVKKAVYASGVPVPKRLTAAELERLQQMAVQVPQQPQAPAQAADPRLAGQQMAPQVQAPVPAQPAMEPQGATVSSFGGSDAAAGQ